MQQFIFDFNGTLFLDTDMHRRAWHVFMSRRGISISDEQFHRYMCGPPNDAILRRFISPDLSDAEIAALAREKEALYRDIVMSDPSLQSLTPGAEAMLDALRAKGIPYAIATGSSRDNVEFYMDTLRIDRWFDYDHVFYAEGSLPGKPDPAIYRLAMEKLRYSPECVTVVEDALPGIRSAAGAGIRSIVAIDTTLGAEVFNDIPEVIAVIHDFHGFERFIN